jgi:hypothetical protein
MAPSDVQVPPGWVLVPLEPTEAMLDASFEALAAHIRATVTKQPGALVYQRAGRGYHVPWREQHAARWRAMCAAAPKPGAA